MLSIFLRVFKPRPRIFVVSNFCKTFCENGFVKQKSTIIMPPKRKVAPKVQDVASAGDEVSPPKIKKSQKQEVSEQPKTEKVKRGANKKEIPDKQVTDKEIKAERPKRGAKKEVEDVPVAKDSKPEKPKAAPKKESNKKEKINPKTKEDPKPKKATKAEDAPKDLKNVTKRGVRPKFDSVDEEPAQPVAKSKKQEAAKKPIKDKDTDKKQASEKPAAKGKKAASKKEETGDNQEAEKGKLLNDSATKWDSIDFSCKSKNNKGETYNLKITSWNVAGARAWLKKDGFSIFKYDSPDILCLQELQCSDDKLPQELKEVEGYKSYRVSSEKEGYAGVAVFSKIMPIDVQYGIKDEKFDNEGRCITLEYEKFFLVNVYVPNAGRGLKTLDKRMEWNEVFKTYIKELDKKKPVILCGDMNVAHEEIDLANPKSNKKSAGFTPEEREGMTAFLKDGYIDTFRELHPETTGAYTFWSYMGKARSKNVGWRLDYFIVSSQIIGNVCDSVMKDQVLGSDHCPISLFINI